MPNFQEFVYWAFLALISGCAVWIARSVSELNVKIAVIIERLGSHETRITKLEKRGDV